MLRNCWQPRERLLPQTEILLWVTLEEPPRALQTSECHELLNPTRTSCLILAQRQPGKLDEIFMQGDSSMPILIFTDRISVATKMV